MTLVDMQTGVEVAILAIVGAAIAKAVLNLRHRNVIKKEQELKKLV